MAAALIPSPSPATREKRRRDPLRGYPGEPGGEGGPSITRSHAMTGEARDDITAVPGVRAGHWTDHERLTGCTVVLTEDGAAAAVDVRGAAPGTRETALLAPGRTVDRVHAILLTGGSAFGLAAADGVMAWLRERGVGFATAA